MASCSICGKTYSVGILARHGRGVAGRRWAKRAQPKKRTFSPNVQAKTVIVGGKAEKINICTKCIKKIKKDGKVKEYSNIAVA